MTDHVVPYVDGDISEENRVDAGSFNAFNRAAYGFATVAAMQAGAIPDGTVTVSVRGFATEGDGEGGLFYWDALSTATPNDYSIFQRAAGGVGRWMRLVGDFTGAVIHTQVFTATAGQTVFNLADAYVAGLNLSEVYINGARQNVGTNYLETDADTITLTSGANVDDVVMIRTMGSVPVGSMLSENVSFTPAGTGAVPRTARSKMRDVIDIRDFGASGGASAAVNGAAIQAALNHLKSEGGELVFEPRIIYAVDRVLDYRNTDILKRHYPRSIKGQGATLDFSAAGITSGGLFKVGADALANASETAWSTIDGLHILGPEDTDDIQPKTVDKGTDAVATTTTIGFELTYALGVNLSNCHVERVWKAYRFWNTWAGLMTNLRAQKAIIGHHIDAGCTYFTMMKPEAQYCTYPYVFRPDTLGAIIGTVLIQAPRAERCTIGFHADPNSVTGLEIQSIIIDNPYMERIYQDAFRAGIEFNADPTTAVGVGSDVVGKIGSITVRGGIFSDEGVAAGYSAARKAFRGATVANICGGSFSFPCAYGDTAHFPATMSFMSTGARAEDLATQTYENVQAGELLAHVLGGGTLSYSRGNIASVTKVGTGTYDLNFKEPYANADNLVALVSPRAATYRCEVDDAGTTTAKVRVLVRDSAGVLADSKFTILVKGQLAAL